MKKNHLSNAFVRFGPAMLICVAVAAYDFAAGNTQGGMIMTGLLAAWAALAYLLYRLDRREEKRNQKYNSIKQ